MFLQDEDLELSLFVEFLDSLEPMSLLLENVALQYSE